MRLARQQIGDRRRRALVGNVGDVDSGLCPEQGAQQMRRRADAGAVIELARVRLGIGDEFLHRLRRHRRPHHEHVRQQRYRGYRSEHFQRLEIELGIKRGRDRKRSGRPEQQRVAVRLGARRGLGTERGARAGPVLDDHLLSEPAGQLVRDQASHRVDRAARRKRHDHLDQPRGILLRCGGSGGNEPSTGSEQRCEHDSPGVHRCALPLLISCHCMAWRHRP